MTNAFFGFNTGPAQASGSSFNIKRKSRSWSADEDEVPEVHHRRIKSPPFDRRHTCPVPDLMTDHSNSNSDEDQDHDHAMDMDDDGDCGMNGGAHIVNHGRHEDQGHSGNYTFGSGGSGGFGFGPGAEEDEEVFETASKQNQYPTLALYPSLTPHPNPNHITNQPRSSTHHSNPLARSTSPLSVQAFSSGLRGPSQATRGVFQPTISGPLGADATDVERARAVHGPQCKSIPKLMLSQYADPATGEKSLWTVCGDCGSCERAS